VEALEALTQAGHITPAACADMSQSYGRLRAIEHRIQMLADEQTHKLPESDAERRRVAALMGQGRLASFDASVERTLKTVNSRYGELFPDEEPLSSRFGSLIFTGVDDDPETLKTLARIGMGNPALVSQTIRSWHHGNIAATRTERGRELFTRLAPRLLDAAQATGAADVAFKRFADFFSRLSSGVQLQALFLANPKLFELVVQVMAFAPRLASTLARRPAALDAMLDGDFFAAFRGDEDREAVRASLAQATGFEEAMDMARRVHREQTFRIGVQVMSATADAETAGRAFADLADALISGLAPISLAEAERLGGGFEGDVAVVALGKCGSREMSAGSDLDLMTVYAPTRPDGVSAGKGWTADVFYGRFTQRLIAALSTPTAEGELYEVDMQLRPSGTKGPVAVSMTAFEDYYEQEAETWELLALTRARVVWASSAEFSGRAERAIEAALRKTRKIRTVAADTREMRDLLARERPPKGPWDLKLCPGGLVDIEFAAQFLQLAHAARGGPLRANTAEALSALGASALVAEDSLEALQKAWVLQQNLTQILKLALTADDAPEDQPAAFRKIMARAAGLRDFRTLKLRLSQAQVQTHQAFLKVVTP
jgi:glutamate-ammonia-ligase adenylyltransferase